MRRVLASNKFDRKNLEVWILRFIKFNIIGLLVFFLGTAVFGAAFPYLGPWAWLAANGLGSIVQFSLITYVNKKKRGVIFESCPTS